VVSDEKKCRIVMSSGISSGSSDVFVILICIDCVFPVVDRCFHGRVER
jgi:hypothetical protein